jgi:hypothetical protein
MARAGATTFLNATIPFREIAGCVVRGEVNKKRRVISRKPNPIINRLKKMHGIQGD